MLIGLEGGFGVIALILWLVALAESITADEAAVRNLPKVMWIVLIFITFDIGAILWFVLGRPLRGRPLRGDVSVPARSAKRAPVGPDDDPRFLDALESDKLQSWEADLLRRERELREKKDDPGT